MGAVVLESGSFNSVFNKILAKFVGESCRTKLDDNELLRSAIESFKNVEVCTESSTGKDAELSNLLGSRAMSLMEENKFDQSIAALTKAILNCPEETKLLELVELRSKALEAAGKQNDALKDREFIQHIRGVSCNGRLEDLKFHKKEEILQKNLIYPAASLKLAFLRSTEVGRYAVAVEDIEPGEAVIVEEAYVSVHLPGVHGSFCHHCYKRSESLMPCPTCPSVGFCSVSCHKESLNSYHRLECRITPLFATYVLAPDWLLTLRTATSRDVESLLEIIKAKDFIKSNATLGLFDLESHSQDMPQNVRAVLAFGAAFLVKCLQEVGYFVGQDTDSTIFPTASLLYHTLKVVKFNTHSIMAQDSSSSKRGRAKAGLALYLVSSLVNHSCDANVFKYFVGDRIHMIANRRIRKGEEITGCYGPRFIEEAYEKRQEYLSTKFYFTCKCEPCIQRWPTGDKLDTEDTYKCPSCFVTVSKLQTGCSCGKTELSDCKSKNKKAVAIWTAARILASLTKVDLAVDLMKEVLNLVETVQHPSRLKSDVEWDFLMLRARSGN